MTSAIRYYYLLAILKASQLDDGWPASTVRQAFLSVNEQTVVLTGDLSFQCQSRMFKGSQGVLSFGQSCVEQRDAFAELTGFSDQSV